MPFIEFISISKCIYLAGFGGQASPRWSIWPIGASQGPWPSCNSKGEGDKEWKACNVCHAWILLPSLRDRWRSSWEPCKTSQWSFWQQLAYCHRWNRWENSYSVISVALLLIKPLCIVHFMIKTFARCWTLIISANSIPMCFNYRVSSLFP